MTKNFFKIYVGLSILCFGLLPFNGFAQNVDLQADKVEFDASGKIFKGRGNVQIRHRGSLLQADKVEYNTVTQDTLAEGNVMLDREGQIWRGTRLKGNFADGEWDLGKITTFQDPFHIISSTTRQVEPGHFFLEEVIITTCDPADKEFYIRARTADVYSENIVRAEGVTFFLNNVPFLYLPSYTIDMEREATNIDVLPGYSSRHGAFLLTAYTIPFSDSFRSVTQFDMRSKRGFGVGQNFFWHNPSVKNDAGEYIERSGSIYKGGLQMYFAQDDEPYSSEEQEAAERAEGIDIDEERYRIRLTHNAQLQGEGNSLFVEGSYLSDQDVVRDFFDEEYRVNPEPENRVSLVHSDPNYTLGLEVSHQLNDEFWDSVNRHPEVSLDVNRVRIGDTPLYFEGEYSGGSLERAYATRDLDRDEDLENYDTLRFHSRSAIYYPKKYMGFLNLIPSLAYYGTYYGDTREDLVSETVDPITTTNGVVTGFTTNSTTTTINGSSELRSLVEFSLESSFKAFKVLETGPVGQGTGLRHVVEPFSVYSIVPDTNLEVENTYQFDSVDKLTDGQRLRLGLRNKLQTKRQRFSAVGATESAVHDLIDLEVYGEFNLDAEDEEETFESVVTDLELRPMDGVQFDVRAIYDVGLSEFEQVNTEAQFIHENESFIGLEHSYRPDRYSTVQAEYGINILIVQIVIAPFRPSTVFCLMQKYL